MYTWIGTDEIATILLTLDYVLYPAHGTFTIHGKLGARTVYAWDIYMWHEI